MCRPVRVTHQRRNVQTLDRLRMNLLTFSTVQSIRGSSNDAMILRYYSVTALKVQFE